MKSENFVSDVLIANAKKIVHCLFLTMRSAT